VKHEINDATVIEAAELFGGETQKVDVVRKKLTSSRKEKSKSATEY
jgi:hypothetical protein